MKCNETVARILLGRPSTGNIRLVGHMARTERGEPHPELLKGRDYFSQQGMLKELPSSDCIHLSQGGSTGGILNCMGVGVCVVGGGGGGGGGGGRGFLK
jgi:hypothetical protein